MRSHSMRSHAGTEPNIERLTPERRRYWQRRLGRIRLGAEPVAWQLERYKFVTWALTVVPLGIAAIIVGIFTAFGAPVTGLAAVAILFGPVIAIAWWDYQRMSAAVRAFLGERTQGES